MYARKLIVFVLAAIVALCYANIPHEVANPRVQALFVASSLEAEAIAAQQHEVIFSVKKRNLDKLESELMAVSTPSSPRYGHHYTRQQVYELTGNPEATSAVLAFLAKHGIVSSGQFSGGEYVKATAPIATWNALLSTLFRSYVHPNTKTTFYRCSSYALPAELEAHVEWIFNTVQYPIIASRTDKKQQLGEAAVAIEQDNKAEKEGSNLRRRLQTVAGSVTPALLNSFYGISSNVGSSSVTQTIYESIGQTISLSDLKTFLSTFGIQSSASVQITDPTYESDSACVSNPNNCGEANLDLQYTIGLSPSTPTWDAYTSAATWTAWIDSVTSTITTPGTISISYGQPDSSVAASDASSFSTAAQQLGLQGYTIFASSGDSGAAGVIYDVLSAGGSCEYQPQFPASCPYVTAVGATQGPEANPPSAEIVCSTATGALITSGGGFSTIFSQPSYQTSAVQSYFSAASAAGTSPGGGYNSAGRGYPDLAAMGHSYLVYIGGTQTPVDGTSASSPVVAAMFSLINAQRVSAGKSFVGFVNPALYSQAGSLTNDITTGNNIAIENANSYYSSNMICPTIGFTATTGWDPTTGWGSPGKTNACILTNKNTHTHTCTLTNYTHTCQYTYLLIQTTRR